MLCEVGVLILVDEYVTEILLIVAAYFGVVTQQQIGVVEQIVKVHCSGHEASVEVGLIYFTQSRTLCAAVGLHYVTRFGILPW